MRAIEFILEGTNVHDNRTFKVGDTTVIVDMGDLSHLIQRKSERDVTPTSVDITLRQMPKFAKQINEFPVGQGFYLADPRLNITLGMRVLSNGIKLATVVNDQIKFSKHYPILTIPHIDPVHEAIEPFQVRTKISEFQLPKNQWELVISNSDKEELGTDLVSLVKQAYHNTPQGSFVKSIKDVIPSDWNVMDWDQDPDVDSTVFYRRNRPGETWQGYKIQGLGHDGTRTSKDKAIQKIQMMLTKPGVWIESSDAMRAVLKKLNVPAVEDERLLQQLFKDPSLKMIDTDTYERQLQGGVHIRETVFGNPKLKGSV